MAKFTYKATGTNSEHPYVGTIDADNEKDAIAQLDKIFAVKRDDSGQQTNSDLITVTIIEREEADAIAATKADAVAEAQQASEEEEVAKEQIAGQLKAEEDRALAVARAEFEAAASAPPQPGANTEPTPEVPEQ